MVATQIQTKALMPAPRADAAGGVARGGKDHRGWPAAICQAVPRQGRRRRSCHCCGSSRTQQHLPTAGSKVLVQGWGRPAAKQRPEPPTAQHCSAGRGTEGTGGPQ